MTTTDARDRLAYLRAIGIDVWVPRTAAPDPGLPAPDVRGAEGEGADVDAGGVAADWAGLESQVSTCTRCALSAGRTQTVFGVGSRSARLMIIGEAPGAEEDRRGEPFVGRAGKLLDEMLRALGLDRGDVFIANILKCRPPNNRDPKPEEAAACRPYLERQIEWVAPDVILAVGRIAAQNLLGSDEPIGRMRTREYRYPGGDTPVIVTYHPAYLLRTPSQKRKAWQDLCRARDRLRETGAA